MGSFQLGKWLVICDRCGFKRMSDEVMHTWDNLIVCKPTIKIGCWESRHPLDFVRSVKEDQSVPFTRTQPADIFRDDLPAVNCDTLDFTFIDASEINDGIITEIIKSRTHGPVIIPGTLTITCTLEIN